MAKKVSKAVQMKIAKFYLFNESSYEKVAIRFGVTKDMVRYYVSKYRNEEYTKDIAIQDEEAFLAEKVKTTKELSELGATNLLNETITDVIAEIRSRGDLTVKDKLDYISKLTMSLKRIQEMEFVDAVKRPDAQKVIKLVQYFYSKATEKEILEAWKILTLEK